MFALVAIACCTAQASEPEKATAQMRDLPKIERQALQAQATLTASGGEIDFVPAQANDAATSEALRSSAQPLLAKSNNGDFAALLGLFSADEALVARLKATRGVAFSVTPLVSGFRLSLTASGQESRTAVHDFLQVPKTPENRSARHPGNNLGWDARRAPDLEK